MEITNKTLAYFVIAAVIVSLTGTILSLNGGLTGYATSNVSGNASVTISSTTTLTFAVGAVDFGTGSVAASDPYACNMSNFNSTTIEHAGNCGTFNTTNSAGGLTLVNDGNTRMNVSVNFSGVASSFIGGGTNAPIIPPKLYFKVGINGTESAACPDLNATHTAWTNVSSTAEKYRLCWGNTGLNTGDAQDSLAIGINITIPHDASGSGSTKVLTIQANGEN